jgi:long-chain acyl-CoA synthetase
MIKTLPEMFADIAKKNARRTAIVENGAEITYEELEAKVASLTNHLKNMGVGKGDRIAILLANGLAFVKSYFAVVTLGAIVVPMNDNYQQTELLYFLDVCGVSLLITTKNHAELCHQVLSMHEPPCKLLFVENLGEASKAELNSLADFKVEINQDSPVMYQFSSGSTGRPKQIARTHANLLFELDSFIETLRVTNEDRFLGVAPFSHVNGLMRSMMACMSAGAALYPVPKFERRTVAELIEKEQISVFIAVPFMFTTLAQTNFRKKPDFSSLRLCVSASAPMPKKLNHLFYENFEIYVRQLYGSTETGTISVNLSPEVAESLESVGTPIKGVEVEVFTDDRGIAGVDEMGEFAVKSPAAIKGYDNLEEVNKETFRNGYFFTGDLGKKNGHGLLYLVGRKKFFINKGGYKINPHDIEEILESHPKVEEVVVIGEPSSYGDEKVKAVIVPKNPCTEAEIVEHCRGKIADFKIPTVIEFRESLPKSPTGKIRRTMLTET